MEQVPETSAKKKTGSWHSDFRLFFLMFLVVAVLMVRSVLGNGYGCGGPSLSTLNMPAPAVKVNDLNGAVVDTEEMKGKVVLVNFWATWCHPCVEELPSIQGLYQKYESNPDFKIMAVSVDDGDDQFVRDFLADYNRKKAAVPLAFPVYHDRDHKAALAYKISGFPTTFLIDKKGVVRKWFVGPRDYNDRHFFAMVDQLLAE